jgi:tetratricopeptide (TPR) repeat protein
MIFALFKRQANAAGPKATAAPDEAPVTPLSYDELAARLREASDAFVAKDIERARAMLEEMILTNPDDLTVRTQLGICHCLLGDSNLGRELLEPVVKEAPDDGDALKFLAACHFNGGDTMRAYDVLQQAIKVAPNDHELYVFLGNLYLELGNYDAAGQQYCRASDMKPESEEPLHRLECLGQTAETRVSFYETSPKIAERRRRVVHRMLAEHRKKGLDGKRLSVLLSLLSGTPATFAKAAELALSLVDFEPMTEELEAQIQRTLLVTGEIDGVLRLAERCFEREPDAIDPQFMLGTMWICSGGEHWSTGWRMITHLLTVARHYNHLHGVPIWEGQKLGNKKLLVYQDQGVGDAILGFRFLPMLKARGIRFHLWVQPPLVTFAEQVPDCEGVVHTPRMPDAATHGCAYAITFFGLIAALYLSQDEIRDPPIVRPAPGHAPALRRRVADLPGTRIGLIYGGNPRRRDDWVRSLPAEVVLPLARLQGVSWVNLMVDTRPEKERVMQALGMTDPMAEVKDFHDTAAIVEELDAVVAVDASVAHVACNLGKPTWVLAPPIRDWRWQIGAAASPWWPSARLLRSASPGEWQEPGRLLLDELQAFLRERSPATMTASD